MGQLHFGTARHNTRAPAAVWVAEFRRNSSCSILATVFSFRNTSANCTMRRRLRAPNAWRWGKSGVSRGHCVSPAL